MSTNVFVDMLKSTNDPRLSAIGTICGVRYSSGVPVRSDQVSDIQQDGGWTVNNTAYKDTYGDYGNMAMDAQNGMPVGGYSSSPTSKDYTVSEVDPWMAKKYENIFFINTKQDGTKDTIYNYEVYYSHYSTVNRYTYADPKAPTFVVTYAQTKLLMAEAAERGFISGDAKQYYEDGVKAAFAQFAQFPNGTGATKIAFPDGAEAAAGEEIINEENTAPEEAAEEIPAEAGAEEERLCRTRFRASSSRSRACGASSSTSPGIRRSSRRRGGSTWSTGGGRRRARSASRCETRAAASAPGR